MLLFKTKAVVCVCVCVCVCACTSSGYGKTILAEIPSLEPSVNEAISINTIGETLCNLPYPGLLTLFSEEWWLLVRRGWRKWWLLDKKRVKLFKLQCHNAVWWTAIPSNYPWLLFKIVTNETVLFTARTMCQHKPLWWPFIWSDQTDLQSIKLKSAPK